MKTIRTGRVGNLSLRLVEKDRAFIGLIFAADSSKKAQIEGTDADDVWRRLHDEASKANPKYFGFDGARARFLSYFPSGFYSPEYEQDERNYKLMAKAKLDKAAPLEEAAIGNGFGKAVLPVFRTNLLFPQEQMRVADALRSSGADDFVRAAARFALGEGKPALRAMERVLKPHNCAKWIVVTYLPFLWRPENHMLLKPAVTTDFATRVGDRFASNYTPELDFAVYESLLDLTDRTTAELADLRPRDRIDVQSLIWVIGGYKRQPGEPKRKK